MESWRDLRDAPYDIAGIRTSKQARLAREVRDFGTDAGAAVAFNFKCRRHWRVTGGVNLQSPKMVITVR